MSPQEQRVLHLLSVFQLLVTPALLAVEGFVPALLNWLHGLEIFDKMISKIPLPVDLSCM